MIFSFSAFKADVYAWGGGSPSSPPVHHPCGWDMRKPRKSRMGTVPIVGTPPPISQVIHRLPGTIQKGLT